MFGFTRRLVAVERRREAKVAMSAADCPVIVVGSRLNAQPTDGRHDDPGRRADRCPSELSTRTPSQPPPNCSTWPRRKHYPVVVGLMRWAEQHLRADEDADAIGLIHRSCGKPAEPYLACSHCHD